MEEKEKKLRIFEVKELSSKPVVDALEKIHISVSDYAEDAFDRVEISEIEQRLKEEHVSKKIINTIIDFVKNYAKSPKNKDDIKHLPRKEIDEKEYEQLLKLGLKDDIRFKGYEKGPKEKGERTIGEKRNEPNDEKDGFDR